MDSSSPKTPHHLPPQNPSSIYPTHTDPTQSPFNLHASQPGNPKHKLAMDKFRDAVMKIANPEPSNSTLMAAKQSLIQQRLGEFFAEFHTPDHPPYAAMIQRAIRELNEKGGSSEESISKYIKKEYDDLPWAHFTLLKHHLVKLCDCGEIILSRRQCYLLADANPNLNSSITPKRQQLKKKRRSESGRGRGRHHKWRLEFGRGRGRPRKKDETEEDDQPNEEPREMIEWQNSFKQGQNEVIGKQNEPNKEKVEEQNQLLELSNAVKDQIEADEQQNEVRGKEAGEPQNEAIEDEARELENSLIESPNLNTSIRPKREMLKRKRRSESGRGRGRPRKKVETEDDDELYEEPRERLKRKQRSVSGRGRGRPRKKVETEDDDELYEEPREQLKRKRRLVSGRGRGRPRKKYETEEDDQLYEEHREKLKRNRRSESGRGRGRLRKIDKTKEDDQLNEGNREVIEWHIPLKQGKDEVTGKQNDPNEEKIEMAEEQNLLLEVSTAIEEQTEGEVRGNEAVEQQNEVIEDEAREVEHSMIGEQSRQQKLESGASAEHSQPQQQKNDTTKELNQPKEQRFEDIEEPIQPLDQEKEVALEEQQIDLIEKPNLPRGQQNGMDAEQNRRDLQIEVAEEQNQQGKQQNEVIEKQSQLEGQCHNVRRSCDEGENDFGNDRRVLPSESPRWILGEEEKEYLQEVKVEQQKKNSCEVGGIFDISDLRAQQQQEGNATGMSLVDSNMDVEQLEKENQPVFSSPERPPGFDLKTVVELSQSQEERSKDCGLWEPQDLLPMMTASIYMPINSVQVGEEHLQQVKLCGDCDQLKHHESQPKQSAPPILLPVDPQQLDQGKQSESLSLERPLEFLRTRVEDFCSEPRQHANCSEAALSEPEKLMAPSIVPMDILQIEKEEHLLLPSPFGLPETIFEHELLESQPTTMTTSTEEIIDSQQFEPEKQPDFLNPEGPPELCALQKPPESRPTSSTDSFTLPVNLDLLEQEQHKVIPNSERPSEVELTTVKELFCTLQRTNEEQQGQRQLRHQSRRQSGQKPAPPAIIMELLPAQHQLNQPELSNPEMLQEVKSGAVELLETQHQQGKEHGQQKRTKSQPKEKKTEDVLVQSEQMDREQLSDLPSSEKSPELKLTTPKSSSQEQQQQVEISGGQEAPGDQTGSMTASFNSPVDPKKLDQEHQPHMSVPEMPIELEPLALEQSCQTERLRRQLSRWSRRPSEPKPEATSMVEPLPSSQSQDQHPLQPELPNLERPRELKQTPATMMELLPMQRQLNQPELSKPERLQEVKPGAVELLETQQQQAKERGQQKRTKYRPKEKDTQDVSTKSDHIEREQLSDLPNLEKFPELKLATPESLSREQQEQVDISGGQEAPRNQPGSTTASFNSPVDPKNVDQEQQPDISVPESPIEVEPLALEQSSQTERLRRQLSRWSRRPSEPKPAATSMLESLASSHDQHPLQPELPNPERPQELKQTPVEESTQIMGQRAKLRSWLKRKTSQPNTMTDSLDLPLASQQLESQQQPELQSSERSPELEPLEEFSQLQQAAQEKPPHRQLRPRPPKPEPAITASTAELLPSLHQHEQQQHEERQGRRRPSKQKPDTSMSESMRSDHQNLHEQEQPVQGDSVRHPKVKAKMATTEAVLFNSNSPDNCQQEQLQEGEEEEQQPKHQGRGRPPKQKPDTSMSESMRSDHPTLHKQEQPVQGDRVRHPKVKAKMATTEAVLFNSNSLDNCQQEQLQQEEQQPKHQGRGRPPKLKKATASTIKNLMPSEMQHQKPKRGRGIPQT